MGGEVFKGLSILDSYSSHSSSCGVYGEVVLSSVGTPCAALPISPGPVAKLEFLIGIFSGLPAFLPFENFFTQPAPCRVFQERKWGRGDDRDESRAKQGK